ncbi:PhaM family polyhydroxyalkanoate granule multifunctional regulatory protein [Massilia sp. TN1-12]|uniref:PhaM family polyhydroxyalkanoate granule multifunctional regulatory protein n=1 Tax=Massilia paldalensis TaxID=3377675 RepID=UPI0038508911
MLKPPAPGIPGMTDTLDFVKNLWGSMHLPGAGMPGMSAMAGPPLSMEDLDKRIADMKAVESWLNLNLTMLRGTIQALEVQRGTLATLRSMSTSMAEAMRQSGVSAEKLAAMPFAPFFATPPGAGESSRPGGDAAAPAPSPADAASGASAQPGTSAPAGQGQDGAGAAAMGMPAAMAWWNMLQDQFAQAVNVAMTPAADSGAKADPAQEQPTVPESATGTGTKPAGGGGSGKMRASKPKAEKP